MSNNIYLISDTHFGHSKVIEFEPSRQQFTTIQEHDRHLVERWNAKVRPKDTVWHLGDVFLGGQDKHEILGSLNGVKRLILGNHDIYPIELYQKYFSKIYGAYQMKGCILTHIPVHPCQLDSRYKVNIHGHMHSKLILDPRYFCVSVESTDYEPVELNHVLTVIDGR